MEDFEGLEILLVEDNPLDAELAMQGLKEGNVVNKIVWLQDGEEALDYVFRRGKYAARGPSQPKLVLLDLKMPKVDGIDVLRALKAHSGTRSIPVVVLTSSQEESDVVASYDLGANSYVVKPIDFRRLAAVTRQTGIYWLAINCPPPQSIQRVAADEPCGNP